jgi:hypothetical protein
LVSQFVENLGVIELKRAICHHLEQHPDSKNQEGVNEGGLKARVGHVD